MNDYKKSFDDKLCYVMKMVNQFGTFKVPLDWFDVSVETPGINNSIRSFKIQNILDMFPEELARMLKACAVTLRKEKYNYSFVANEKLSKV